MGQKNQMTSLPKGIIVFAIIAALDAIASMMFIIYFITVPEITPIINESDFMAVYFANITEYKILGTVFSDNLIVGFAFVIIVDALMVIGLLSSKIWSRKLVIGCTSIGIIFNVGIMNFPGLIFNVILLGYMLKTSTKEYYLKTI